MDAADESCSPFLGILRYKDQIHLEFTIAVFSTPCWKLPKNKASMDKRRTESWDQERGEMGRFQ